MLVILDATIDPYFCYVSVTDIHNNTWALDKAWNKNDAAAHTSLDKLYTTCPRTCMKIITFQCF